MILKKIPKHLIGSPAGRSELPQATLYGIKPFMQRFKLQTVQECKIESHDLVSRNDIFHNLHCATLFTFKRSPVILTIHGFMQTTYFILTRIKGRTFHEHNDTGGN